MAIDGSQLNIGGRFWLAIMMMSPNLLPIFLLYLFVVSLPPFFVSSLVSESLESCVSRFSSFLARAPSLSSHRVLIGERFRILYQFPVSPLQQICFLLIPFRHRIGRVSLFFGFRAHRFWNKHARVEVASVAIERRWERWTAGVEHRVFALRTTAAADRPSREIL
jgi:hypothetical protein